MLSLYCRDEQKSPLLEVPPYLGGILNIFLSCLRERLEKELKGEPQLRLLGRNDRCINRSDHSIFHGGKIVKKELSIEEIELQALLELPDRKLMSLLTGGIGGGCCF